MTLVHAKLRVDSHVMHTQFLCSVCAVVLWYVAWHRGVAHPQAPRYSAGVCDRGKLVKTLKMRSCIIYNSVWPVHLCVLQRQNWPTVCKMFVRGQI